MAQTYRIFVNRSHQYAHGNTHGNGQGYNQWRGPNGIQEQRPSHSHQRRDHNGHSNMSRNTWYRTGRGGPNRSQERTRTGHWTRHNNFQTRGNPRSAARVETDNDQFGLIISKVFEAVQLRHHLDNWSSMPVSIDRNIETFFKSINPPRPKQELINDIAGIKHVLKNDLIEAVDRHIRTQLDNTNTQLRRINPTDKHKVQQIVKRKLLRNINRINRNKIDQWIDSSIDFIGTDYTHTQTAQNTIVKQVAEPAVRLVTEQQSTPWKQATKHANKQIQPQTLTDNAHTVDNTARQNKRHLPVSPQAIATSNRFEVLNDLDQDQETNTVIVKPVKMRKLNTKQINDAGNGEATANEPMEACLSAAEATEAAAAAAAVNPIPTVATPAANEIARDVVDKHLNANVNNCLINSLEILNNNICETDASATEAVEDDAVVRSHIATATTTAADDTARDVVEKDKTDNDNDLVLNFNKRNVYVHDGQIKQSWELLIKSRAANIILADSNFRLCDPAGKDVELHVYPGATLGHAHCMLNKADIPDTVRNIVIAVGINNRSWDFETVTSRDLAKLQEVTEKLKARVHFLGISAPTLPCAQFNDRTSKLNEEAEKIFNTRFIKPLPSSTIMIRDPRTYAIHHHNDTVSRIYATITKHLNL